MEIADLVTYILEIFNKKLHFFVVSLEETTSP